MKKLIRDYKFFLVFFFVTVLLSFSSTWVNRVLNISILANRVMTLFVYVPFCAAIVWKLVTDLRSIKKKKPDILDLIYYVFALYYGVISVYRLMHGMEIKESFYYCVVFFGSVAAYLMIRSGAIRISEKELSCNICAITLYVIIYNAVYRLFGTRYVARLPININLLLSVIAVELPYIMLHFCNKNCSKMEKILYGLTIFGGAVTIATAGSRAFFWLSLITDLVVILANIKNKKGFLRIVSTLGIACVFVIVLMMADVGRVRYAIYRETNIGLFNWAQEKPEDDSQNPAEQDFEDDFLDDELLLPEDSEDDAVRHEAQQQTVRSDQMRSQLFQMGMDQVKLNPWFGTGDVLYYYQISETYGVMQSSHNVVIETIICCGIVGCVMIIALFLAIVADAKFFVSGGRSKRPYKIVMVLSTMIYLGIGLIQPIVFHPLVCPVYVLSLAACRQKLESKSSES